MALPPTVRVLTLSEDLAIDGKRVSILGLLSQIKNIDDEYPLLYREICLFGLLSECHDTAEFYVVITHAEQAGAVFVTKRRQQDFGDDPLEVFGIPFRIRNCVFPWPGLYWFQLVYNDEVIGEYPLVVR